MPKPRWEVDPFPRIRSLAYFRDWLERRAERTNAKENRSVDRQTVDTERDRFPDLIDVINAIVEADVGEETPVERLEVFCHASGEATYRYWTPRAEFPEVGYFPAEKLNPDVG
jgi:hypothetical protein